MNKYKFRIIFCYIGIIITLIVMFLTIYAYITYKKENNEIDNKDSLSEKTNIKFNDTSNISLVDYNSSEVFTKTFSIENTSNKDLYYNIKLGNIINNYDDKDSIKYSIYYSDKVYRTMEVFPSEDEYILSNVKISPKEKQDYNLEISISNKETGKTISTNVIFEESKNNLSFESNSLMNKIITDSSSFKDIDINGEVVDGVYYTNSSINGNKIYFYRGSNLLNNNVVFNNVCYKMIRTTIDGGVRFIYNGIYENNVCLEEKSLEELSSYNSKYNSNAYVGYMYGEASSGNYINEHKNVNSSIIKIRLESWFKDNLITNESILKTSIYCNYRKTHEFSKNGVSYTKQGYSNLNTGYYKEDYPSFDCKSIDDRLSVNTINISSTTLSYPVGLITVDELIFAGLNETVENKNNFLYTKDDYYTLSAAYYNGNGAYVYSVNNGKIIASRVDSKLSVRPVITINGNISIKSGDGSIESPYIL